jgi:hypothetical protein
MNQFSNLWNHPKTSIAGLLIAVVTVTGVLTQQGISLGSAGTGTIASLMGALASALLGLLAKDPDSAPGGDTAKLGAWMLIALLIGSPLMSGCSGVTVAQDIVNWTPSLQSAVATVDSTAALLAPADAPVFMAATVGFDTASNVLVGQAKAYLANPTAALLAQLQSQVVTLQQQVNTALLKAGQIVDPKSQQHALSAIQVVGSVVGAMLALVESVSSKTAVAQMAAQSPIKLAAVQIYFDEDKTVAMVATHYGEQGDAARMRVELAEREAMRVGF